MALYTVLAPLPPDMSADADPEAFVFVKDGFCWPCLFVPGLWIIFRRMWLVLILYIVAALVLAVAAAQFRGPVAGLSLLLAHVYFALEANGLRRWTLFRRGYTMIGVAEGRRMAEAEIRFFQAFVAPQPPPRDPRQPPPARIQAVLSPPRPSAESGDVVGFFPVPGGSS